MPLDFTFGRTAHQFGFMVTVVPQGERAQIDAVRRRLAQKYAELPHDYVTAVVQHTYARFDGSTVRDFIPLLVERRASEELAVRRIHDLRSPAQRPTAGQGDTQFGWINAYGSTIVAAPQRNHCPDTLGK